MDTVSAEEPNEGTVGAKKRSAHDDLSGITLTSRVLRRLQLTSTR